MIFQDLIPYFFPNNISKKRFSLPLLLIGILATALYWRMLDNFFFSDDFEWLDQVKNLELRSLSIFNPVVHPPSPYAQLTPLPPDYFTPLIHIIFWINYKLFGLNPFGYHLLNLILHIINSYLVVYFVFLLGNNLGLATLVGLFFATSFSITNAVVWPSAYVDTVMFSFYILSLIAFLSFLRKGKQYHYVSSILLFILSLASKGTALALPLVLFLIEKYHNKSNIHIKHLSKYIPFASIILGYLALLLYNSPVSVSGQIDFNRVILNAVKVPMTLLIPEGLLPVNPGLTLLSVLLFSVFVIALIKGAASGIGRLGILLILVGVFPLFIINWNFSADPDPLTDSISHRLYLGNLGFAMFIGGIVHSYYAIIRKGRDRALLTILGVAFIGYNVYWNQRIQNSWDKVTNETRDALNEIRELVVSQPPDRVYRFINFPPRQHFGAKLFKLFFEPYDMASGTWPMEGRSYIDRNKILFLIQMNGHIYNDPEVAKKAVSTPWEHFYLAHFYLLIGDNQNGISELDKSTVSISDEKIHYFAAITYRKLGLSSKAIEELKKVIQINEYSKYAIDTYKLLSFLSFKTGDLDSAIKYLEKAVYLNNKDVDAMGALAQLYEDKGEADRAKELRKRASIGH